MEALPMEPNTTQVTDSYPKKAGLPAFSPVPMQKQGWVVGISYSDGLSGGAKCVVEVPARRPLRSAATAQHDWYQRARAPIG